MTRAQKRGKSGIRVADRPGTDQQSEDQRAEEHRRAGARASAEVAENYEPRTNQVRHEPIRASRHEEPRPETDVSGQRVAAHAAELRAQEAEEKAARRHRR